MQFKKEDLQSLVYDETIELEKIRDEQIGSSRWTSQHDLIFKFEEHYYLAFYSLGLTEQQDTTAFEFEPDLIECAEVWPFVTTKVDFTYVEQEYSAGKLARLELLI